MVVITIQTIKIFFRILPVILLPVPVLASPDWGLSSDWLPNGCTARMVPQPLKFSQILVVRCPEKDTAAQQTTIRTENQNGSPTSSARRKEELQRLRKMTLFL
ncbi:hypothetical protein [Candidatus Regiella insecticola]|nr:hypothetical protein [Candidatus Regiella insecticola]